MIKPLSEILVCAWGERGLREERFNLISTLFCFACLLEIYTNLFLV